MAEEYEDGANGEEGGVTGPGAPTPVHALEVSFDAYMLRCAYYYMLTYLTASGSRRLDEEGLSTFSRRRLPDRRVGCLYSKANPGTGQGYIRTEGCQDPRRR